MTLTLPKGVRVYSTAPAWPIDGRPSKRQQTVSCRESGDRLVWAGAGGYWRWVKKDDPLLDCNGQRFRFERRPR